ncbi:hypothetical protein, partial [Pectobacterium atrosepticum]|uniref:hypothetical protein n=1 Tax=Pectobacterium atrosepticum TaxID=29471 RepID=UPI001C62BD97
KYDEYKCFTELFPTASNEHGRVCYDSPPRFAGMDSFSCLLPINDDPESRDNTIKYVVNDDDKLSGVSSV